jgi:adenylate kinase
VVVEFQIDDSLLVSRILGRWTHKRSGRSYHEEFNPPKVPQIDDVTNEPLERRSDDTAETLNKRVEQFHLNTKPLTEYYSKNNLLREIDASKPPKEVSEDIRSVFDSLKNQVSCLHPRHTFEVNLMTLMLF